MLAGNVRGLDDELHAHLPLFIKQGVYFLLERLKRLAFRNFFKHVHRLKEGTGNQMHLRHFLFPLYQQLARPREVHTLSSSSSSSSSSSYSSSMAEEDEEECFEDMICELALLIQDKKVKGYISHEHEILVLDRKNNPFPTAAVVQEDV